VTPSTPVTPSAPTTDTGVEDPLALVEDSESGFYIPDHAEPLVHSHDIGPGAFPVAVADGVTGVQVFVACSPESTFTVYAFDNFYSGPCTHVAINSATIPVPNGVAQTEIELDLPDDVDRFLVAIPIESNG